MAGRHANLLGEAEVLNMLFAAAVALQPGSQIAVEPAQFAPPPPEQVLAIPDGLRSEFRRKVLETKSPEQRLYKLVDFMLKPNGLGLQYEANATHTVAESYLTRKANCMGFTIMAVALAREAGLTAYAQQIDRIMAWNMTGNVVMQNLHANAAVFVGKRKYMLDIAAGDVAQPVVDSLIDDRHLLSLFYGNRAMELLASGHPSQAMAWQEEALRLGPQDAAQWSNAGVLRQRLGRLEEAERMYLKAVDRSPRLTSALSNLVALYQGQQKYDLAAYWQGRSERLLGKDPYYQFAQGRREQMKGDNESAVGYFKRAISLQKKEPVFHFSLATAYFQEGRLREADTELGMAKRLSDGAGQRLYQQKIDALHRIFSQAELKGAHAVTIPPR